MVYTEIEIPMISLLYKIEMAGMKVDVVRAEDDCLRIESRRGGKPGSL